MQPFWLLDCNRQVSHGWLALTLLAFYKGLLWR